MTKDLFIKKLHKRQKKVRLVWLHGWGVDHSVLEPIASYFGTETENYLIDLPGFGRSFTPKKTWGSEEYAKRFGKWIKNFKSKKPLYIIGYSLGGQIAVRMAKMYPKHIKGVILLAASGLKRKRSVYFKTKRFLFNCARTTAKLLLGKKIFNVIKQKLVRRVGSTDYRNANEKTREILVKIVQEDLTDIASEVKIPALIIYGSDDKQAPAYLGEKYSELIKNSRFVELPNLNHFTILSAGKNQVQNLISNFLKQNKL